MSRKKEMHIPARAGTSTTVIDPDDDSAIIIEKSPELTGVFV